MKSTCERRTVPSCSLWYSVYHCSHYLKVLSLQGASVFNCTLLWGLICRHHPLSELALLRESRSLFSSLSLIVLNIKPLCSVLLNRASCGTETLCSCFKFFSYQLTDALISQFLQVLGAHEAQEEMSGTRFCSIQQDRGLFLVCILEKVTVPNHLRVDSQNPRELHLTYDEKVAVFQNLPNCESWTKSKPTLVLVCVKGLLEHCASLLKHSL